MEEIKVGEYCRTYNGNIFKIIDGNSDNYDIDIDYYKLENTEEEWYELNRYNDNGYFFNEKHIKKHSPNIIDLIEEDDIGIMRYNGLIFKKFITKDDILELKFKNYELLEIVTKEQFNQVKYEV